MASGTELPTVGRMAYNGVEFRSPAHTSAISETPVMDRANRMVKYFELRLTVGAYIYDPEAGADTTEVMENLRRKLLEPGGVLIYEGKGFGDLTINEGTLYDVKWGPQPELLNWQPIGSDMCAYIEWRVSFRIPECARAKTKNRLMSWTYETSFSIDSDGYLSFSYSGEISVPITFGTNNTLPDSADNYWDKVFPVLPVGFKRVTNQRTLSADRTTLTFSVVDEELPFPLPLGCTFAQLRHRLETTRARQTINVNASQHTFTGTFHVSPRYARGTSWLRFSAWVRKCFETILKPSSAYHPTALVLHFAAETEVLNRPTSYSLSVLVTRVAGLARIIQDSGLWILPPDSDYATWKGSVVDGPYSAYGNAGATFNQAGETLVDLCTGKSGVGLSVPNRPAFESQSHTPASATVPSGAVQVLNDTVAEASSWISYTTSFDYREDPHLVRHTPLSGTVTMTDPGSTPTAGTNLDLRSSQVTISQRTAPPAASVRIQGAAWRIGFAGIQAPILKKFQGVDATRGRIFKHKGRSFTTVCGTTVHSLVWDIEYHLAKPPASLPLAATLIGAGGPQPQNDVNLSTAPIQRPGAR